MAVARIAGLLVERREVGEPGAFTHSEVLDAIERRHGKEVRDLLEAALAGNQTVDYQQPDEKA
jgi:hypothetical protein